MSSPTSPSFKRAIRLCREIDSLRPGAQAIIVGGAVRDYLRGVPSDDIDIAHNLPIEVIKERFQSEGVGKGEDFGVSVATFEGERFELTCFRKDGLYIDGRRPESVSLVTDFREDSARRDFTINAMGMTSSGDIIDYWGGREDLKTRTIRSVGCSLDRFSEDPVRMFRALRFAATLDFDLDQETSDGVRAFAIRARDVASERITKELFKSADTGRSLATFISLADKTHLLPQFLPEISLMKGFSHSPKWHPEGGVFEHTLAALRASEETDPERNLSILLHDIGKPSTYKPGKTGDPTYYGHEAAGVPLVREVGARLKWPKALIEMCCDVAEFHGKFHCLGEMRQSSKIDLWLNDHFDEIKAASMADERCRLHAHNEAAMQAKFADMDRAMAPYGKREDRLADIMLLSNGRPTEFKARLHDVSDGRLEQILTNLNASGSDRERYFESLNAMSNGRVIKDAVPGVEDKQIKELQGRTKAWLLAENLEVTPQQVKSQISFLHNRLSR